MILKIAVFLRLIDDDGKLNIADLAFIIILLKISFSNTLDWPSIVVLATTCLNSAHQRSVNASDDPQLIQLVQDQATQLKSIQDKIVPIISAIGSKLS